MRIETENLSVNEPILKCIMSILVYNVRFHFPRVFSYQLHEMSVKRMSSDHCTKWTIHMCIKKSLSEWKNVIGLTLPIILSLFLLPIHLIMSNSAWKPKSSYKILAPKAVEELKDAKDPKKIAQVVLDAVGLDAESYRLGNTKAWIHPSFFSLCLKLQMIACVVFWKFSFLCHKDRIKVIVKWFSVEICHLSPKIHLKFILSKTRIVSSWHLNWMFLSFSISNLTQNLQWCRPWTSPFIIISLCTIKPYSPPIQPLPDIKKL